MSIFTPRLEEYHFILEHVINSIPRLNKLPPHQELSLELLDQIIAEAGKFASEVLAPLNQVGDIEGCTLQDDIVNTPTGLKEAYQQFCAQGWNGLAFPEAYGGQGLPWLLNTIIQELWTTSNVSFSLCPLLTQGTVEMLLRYGTEAQKRLYLDKLVSGEWTGTMNLTEPNAGSDVGALVTKAVPEGDHYLIFGQKLFITFGDHDFTENVIHMVLARTPNSPKGIKGISVFMVPKFLVNEDGSLGARNEVNCVSLEHKMGIHASPTALMSYGDDKGAIGYLIGEENRGIEYMFTMMNNARLGVGVQGLGLAERALQQAMNYAQTRIQGTPIGRDHGQKAYPILCHQDVKKQLLTMRSLTTAMRALACEYALTLDESLHHQDPHIRAQKQARVELLTPIIKAWLTDNGVLCTELNIRVHGGMGYIEETGAAQLYRDSIITTIYEGTNGIQANDFMFRKVLRDQGTALKAFLEESKEALSDLKDEAFKKAQELALQHGFDACAWVLDQAHQNKLSTLSAIITPFLKLTSLIAGGTMYAKILKATSDQNYIDEAHFYAHYVLSATIMHLNEILMGDTIVNNTSIERLSA